MKELIFDKTRRIEEGKTYKAYIFRNKAVNELTYLLDSFDRNIDVTNIKAFNNLVHTAAYKFHKADYAIKVAQHAAYLYTAEEFISEKLITEFYYAQEVQELKRLFGQIPIDVSLCEVSKYNDELILKEVKSSDKDWIILNYSTGVDSDEGIKLINKLRDKVVSFMFANNLSDDDVVYNIMNYSIRNIKKKK